MSIVTFAESELKRAGLFDEDGDYGGMMGRAVMKMIEQFAEEGHSGFSAGMAISIFERLARYEPLSPLTGEDDEWNDVSTESGRTLWQNRRCSRVFKGESGAYDIQGTVFEDPDGSRYTSRDSRVPVTFPYTPKTAIVKVQPSTSGSDSI